MAWGTTGEGREALNSEGTPKDTQNFSAIDGGMRTRRGSKLNN